MARWTELATWRGNGENQGPGGMVEHRGLVLHIAVGWYEGTISWQRNPTSRVSSHFVVGRERGELAQMVDTAVRAWTQGDGNGRWLSSENEGFLAKDSRNPGGWEKLSAWQIEANAQLLAKAHLVYGVPLAVADHPGERGLGHHSMDREWLDEQWGHDECPGAAIVAQKPAIVARAKEIVEGDEMPTAAEIVDELLSRRVVSRVTGNEVPLGATILGGGYEQSYRGRELAATILAEQRAGLAALSAAVTGKDVTAAVQDTIRVEFARLGPALAAELADVPAERVEAALRSVLGSLDEGGA